MQLVWKVSDLLPKDLQNGRGGAEVTIPPWAFRPDQWNVAFLRGLRTIASAWESQRIWEVGVGTGLNIIALWDFVSRASWYFSDYNARCVELACRNLMAAGIDKRYTPLPGKTDLVEVPREKCMPRIDVIFGCLPQVPISTDLEEGDRVAHYYDPEQYPWSRRHGCGLGLNEALLAKARQVLAPNGRVILNLSGRPGLPRLRSLFQENGYEPRIIHSEIVAQHPDTSLKTLAGYEAQGEIPFEFFARPEGAAISASEAEARRIRRQPVYHNIYVIEGTCTC